MRRRLDGTGVNDSDLNIVLSITQTAPSGVNGWMMGHFNGDAAVNGPDLNTCFELSQSAVPEPSTIILVGTGAVALAAYGRRRRKGQRKGNKQWGGGEKGVTHNRRTGATAGLSSSAVLGRLMSLVQPFGGQAMNGRQAGVLLRRIEQIVSGTRPFPAHSPLDKSTANGIMMQVVDGVQHRGRLGEVPVVAGAFLPVAKRFDSRTLMDCQPFHRPIHALRQHPSPRVVGQQGPTMVARERQFVDMAGIVVMPYSFSMSRSPFPATYSNDGHCWTSQQWHRAHLIERLFAELAKETTATR